MSVLRDAALIILALEGAVIAFAIVALLAGVNYGLFYSRWWRVLPYWFSRFRGYLDLGLQLIERACQVAIAPFLFMISVQSGLARRVRRLLGPRPLIGRGKNGAAPVKSQGE